MNSSFMNEFTINIDSIIIFDNAMAMFLNSNIWDEVSISILNKSDLGWKNR